MARYMGPAGMKGLVPLREPSGKRQRKNSTERRDEIVAAAEQIRRKAIELNDPTDCVKSVDLQRGDVVPYMGVTLADTVAPKSRKRWRTYPPA